MCIFVGCDVLVLPVYKIKDYEKVKSSVENIKHLAITFSKINGLKIKQAFAIRGKYLIPSIISTPNYEDPLLYIIYWLLKEKAIELSHFYTSSGSVITRNKNPVEFKVFSNLLEKVHESKVRTSVEIFKLVKINKTPVVEIIPSKESKRVVVGFEPKTIIDAGDKRLLGIKVYYSTIPVCDFRECCERNMYPRSWTIVSYDFIVTVVGDKVRYVYFETFEGETEFCNLSEVKFSVRDVISLLSLKRVYPYSKMDVFLFDDASKEFLSKAVKNPTIPSIIKGLLLINPDKVELDEKKLRIISQRVGKIDINLKNIRKLVMGRIPITLSKYLKLSHKSYDELGIIKVPSQTSELFKPNKGNIDWGVYAVYKGYLLIPLLMVESGHYFIVYHLLAGLILYGLLKGWIPYKCEKDEFYDEYVSIQSAGKIRIIIKPFNYSRNIISCYVDVDDSIPSTNDSVRRRSVYIHVSESVMKKLLPIISPSKS